MAVLEDLPSLGLFMMGHAAQPPSTCSSLLVHVRDASDAAAWRTFVDLYTPLVYRFAQRRGLQDADAQDVVQQVFTRVTQAIRSFEYDPLRGRFRGWLGTITAQTIGRHLKQRARQGQGGGLGGDEQAMDALAHEAEPVWIDEFGVRVRQVALERIRTDFDPLVWQAFELTWLRDRQPKEVAETVQKPATWVYKAKFKVLQRLKQEIQFLSADVAFYADE